MNTQKFYVANLLCRGFWPLKLQSSEYLISSRFLVIAKQRTPKLVISRVCSIYSDSEIRSIEHALRLSVALIYSVTNCEQQQQRILQRLKELPTQTAAPLIWSVHVFHVSVVLTSLTLSKIKWTEVLLKEFQCSKSDLVLLPLKRTILTN